MKNLVLSAFSTLLFYAPFSSAGLDTAAQYVYAAQSAILTAPNPVDLFRNKEMILRYLEGARAEIANSSLPNCGPIVVTPPSSGQTSFEGYAVRRSVTQTQCQSIAADRDRSPLAQEAAANATANCVNAGYQLANCQRLGAATVSEENKTEVRNREGMLRYIQVDCVARASAVGSF